MRSRTEDATVARPEHVQEHRHGERDVGDGLDQGRPRLQPEHPGQERRLDAARIDEPGQVERLLLQTVHPAGLVGGMERGCEQAGGDEHEHDAGDAEEPGQVDVDAPAIDPPADGHRDDDSEHRAASCDHRVGRGVERGQEEHRGLEALADDCEEGHPDERRDGADGERARRAVLQLPLERPPVPAHPDDHERDRGDRHEPDDRLQALLLLLRQLLAQHVEPDAHRRADADRETDPDPHPAQHVATPLLAQERGHDAHDQGGLEALSEPDHEGGQHQRATVGSNIRADVRRTIQLVQGSTDSPSLPIA